jgi:hypothetical protein
LFFDILFNVCGGVDRVKAKVSAKQAVTSVKSTANTQQAVPLVKTVEEYLREVDKIYKKVAQKRQASGIPDFTPKIWYRGVKRASFNLDPSITRPRTIAGKVVQLNTDYETLYLSRFKAAAYPYVLEKLPSFPYGEDEASYWLWQFLMQEYGIPTRLLDWSKDALVALLFAITDRNAFEQQDNATVWILDPNTLNEAFKFSNIYKRGYIPNVQEPSVTELFGPDSSNPFNNKKPAAIYGPRNTQRIIAQKGVFTVYPKILDLVPLNLLPDSSQYLYRINLDKNFIEKAAGEVKVTFTDQLRRYGFVYADLFPEIENVNLQISEEGF